jgi:hypothetical protein
VIDLEPLLAPGVAEDSDGMSQFDQFGTMFPLAVDGVRAKILDSSLIRLPQAM